MGLSLSPPFEDTERRQPSARQEKRFHQEPRNRFGWHRDLGLLASRNVEKYTWIV